MWVWEGEVWWIWRTSRRVAPAKSDITHGPVGGRALGLALWA